MDSIITSFMVDRLNDYLLRSSWARRHFAKLEGQIIEIVLIDLSQTIRIVIKEGSIGIHMSDTEITSVSVRGSIRDFATTFLSARRGESLPAGRLEISGDVSVIQHIQEMLSTSNDGWEEFLTNTLGEIGAHRLMRAASKFGKFWEVRAGSFTSDLSDYLRFEARLLPDSREVKRMIDDIWNVSDEVERTESRLKNIIKDRYGYD